jgi:hypothetical protein
MENRNGGKQTLETCVLIALAWGKRWPGENGTRTQTEKENNTSPFSLWN